MDAELAQRFKESYGVLTMSGGKDSLLAGYLSKDLFEDYEILYVKTPNANDMPPDYQMYLEKLFDRPLTVLDGASDVETYLAYREDQFPEKSPQPHHCCFKVKGFNQVLKPYLQNLVREKGTRVIITHGQLSTDFATSPTQKTYMEDKLINIPLALSQIDTYVPLVEMCAHQVRNEIIEADLEVNPNYHKGFTKNSCFPCTAWAGMGAKVLNNEITVLKKEYPEEYEKWCNWEKTNDKPYFRDRFGAPTWLHKM